MHTLTLPGEKSWTLKVEIWGHKTEDSMRRESIWETTSLWDKKSPKAYHI